MRFITKRHEDGYAVFAGATATEPVPGSVYRDRKDATRHRAAMEGCLANLTLALAEFVAGDLLAGSADRKSVV